MSDVHYQPIITTSAREVNSEEDIISGDIIDVDFPHVRPEFDKTLGKKVFSKQRPALVLYTKPRQMVVAYISSKIPASLDSVDVLITQRHPSFKSTGLRASSVLKLGVLATIPFEKVINWRGSVDDALRSEINKKIASHIKA
jgi:mRNA interferase MazF